MEMTAITHQEIEARARSIWEQCGCPDGYELEHWLRAERELEKEHQQAEEFRAGLSESGPSATTQRKTPCVA